MGRGLKNYWVGSNIPSGAKARIYYKVFMYDLKVVPFKAPTSSPFMYDREVVPLHSSDFFAIHRRLGGRTLQSSYFFAIHVRPEVVLFRVEGCLPW